MRVLAKETNLLVDLPLLDESEATPLLAACENGNLAIVQLLMQLNANIHHRETDTGRSALLLACVEDHYSIVEYLLQSMTNEVLYNDFSKQHESAVSTACENGSENSLELLLARVSSPEGIDWINKKEYRGRTPLFSACAYKHLKVVQKLLKSKANPNRTDDKGVTPLFISVQNGDASISEELLKAKADPNTAREEDGIAPLHLVSLLGHSEELLLCLIHNNSSINQQSKFGETSLLVACQENRISIAQKLLELNADANIPLDDGTSPLLDACEASNIELIKLLLAHSADINQTRTCDNVNPKQFIDNLVL